MSRPDIAARPKGYFPERGTGRNDAVQPRRPAAPSNSAVGQNEADTDDIGRLMPLREICAELGVGRRTVGRRMIDDPDFPRVVFINNRGFADSKAVQRYKRVLMRRHFEGRDAG